MKTFLLMPLLLLVAGAYCQSIGIGISNPNSSAALEIKANSKGILIPRTSSTSRLAVVSPAKGLLLYDTTTSSFWFHNGGSWQEVPAVGSGWGVTGNSGTDMTKNFIGTTDLQSLVFKVYNRRSGFIDISNTQNTAWGYAALESNTTGYYNTATGNLALGYNTTGHHNTANGLQALVSNESGSFNTAYGFSSLGNNSTGTNNTASGCAAMQGNSTGNFNTGMGYYALRYNGQGGNNTAFGSGALQNNSGTAAYYNTAVGFQALSSTTNSQFNTAIGYNAGQAYDNGYNNVFVGANTDVNSGGYYNVIAIGQGTICTASSQVTIGNGATGSYRAYANWSNISDGRFKKDLKADVKGIDFIMKLKPVTYHLDVSALNNALQKNQPPGNKAADGLLKMAIATKESVRFSGFVAQEVETAAMESGYDFSGIDKPKNKNDFYALRYAEFVVPLVKAVQEQELIISDQTQVIKQQQQKMEDLEKRLLALENRLSK